MGLRVVQFGNDDVMRYISSSLRFEDVSPALPKGFALLQATVTAVHKPSEIERAMNVIGKAKKKLG